MIINGQEYTQEETLEALKNKGYKIVYHEFYFEDQTFPNDFEVFRRTLACALKGDEQPSEENIWREVAIKEFELNNEKPPLI